MGAPEKEILKELGARLRTALEKLEPTIEEQKKYFEEAVVRIKASLPLSESEERELEEFGSRCSALLEQARAHGRERLRKLAEALEHGQYVSERSGKNTWRVKPAGEEWFAGVVESARKTGHAFRLPLHGINTTLRFPDILKLPLLELEELQLGWRASDEGRSAGYPIMTTTRAWQLPAWLACRPGRAWVAVLLMNLTKQGPSIEWQALALDWRQRWKSKEEALRTLLESVKPRAWLTCFLGDGTLQGPLSGGGALLYANGRKSVYFPKSKIEMAVQAAGRYGILLEALKCPKWEALKRCLPKSKPLRVKVEGVLMTLGFNRSSTGWSLKLCKHATEKEAEMIAEHLRRCGYNPSVSKSAVAGIVKYYLVILGAKDVAKLAQRDTKVLKAVLELAERKGVKCGEVLKRLGVAESPPLLSEAPAVKLPEEKLLIR
jgi:hypothetical protein